VEIATRLGATAQSLWFADGTNYPGQDDLRARRRRMTEALGRLYAALPPEQELLVEYKFFEPAFYATDLADWGSSLLICQKLREERGAAADPVAALRSGGYVEKIVGARGATATVAGGWGR